MQATILPEGKGSAGVVVNSTGLASILKTRRQFHHASLGSLLVAEKIITQSQLDEALSYQHQHQDKKLGAILSEMGAATSLQIYLAVARSLGAPIVSLSGFDFDPRAIALITPELAHTHHANP